MSKPNTWKDRWPEMEKWYYEEKLSYNKIRERAFEKWGEAPSKGTMSPHFNKATKEKAAYRQEKYRSTLKGRLVARIHKYKIKQPTTYKYAKSNSTVRERIRINLKEYRKKGTANKMEESVGIDEVIKYLTKVQKLDLKSNTAISPLTGRVLDLDKEFHLDHWNPEGGNTLENIRILSREENMMKSNLHADELKFLCNDIIAMGHESSSF